MGDEIGTRRHHRRYVILLVFSVLISFIIILTESKIIARYQFTGGWVIPNNLQSESSSVENIHNTSHVNSDRCSRILLYDTDLVAKDTGIGHRIAFYALASTVAATTDSALVLLEPPEDSENNIWAKVGGSPFGCPTMNGDHDGLCDKLPNGLSRIMHVPPKLSRGCDVPMNVTCTVINQNGRHRNRTSFTIKSYRDWTRISKQTIRGSGFPEVTCNHSNGITNMTVLAIGGIQLKYYWGDKARSRLVQRLWRNDNSTKQQRKEWEKWMEDWSTRMGLTIEEVREYTCTNGIINNKKNDDSTYVEEYNLIDYLNAMLNRAQIPQFQPWVIRDIRSAIQKIDLPQPSSAKQLSLHDAGGGYDAMHVRRGDSLTRIQSILATEEYWVQRGYPARVNKTEDIATLSAYPTNYVPFVQYWEQYVSYSDDCSISNSSSTARKVYIATDDIRTVKSEITNLTAANGQQFWKLCNKRVEFIFNHQVEYTTHLHQHLDPNTKDVGNKTLSGYDQYSRALTALVDLHILARSDVFVGDFRSYFTRLLMMLRTSFHGNIAHRRAIVIAWGGDSNSKQPPWK